MNRAAEVGAKTPAAVSDRIKNYSGKKQQMYCRSDLRDHAILFTERSACGGARRVEGENPRNSDLRARNEIGAWLHIDSPAIVIVEAGKVRRTETAAPILAVDRTTVSIEDGRYARTSNAPISNVRRYDFARLNASSGVSGPSAVQRRPITSTEAGGGI
jgi:hypothetical protein